MNITVKRLLSLFLIFTFVFALIPNATANVLAAGDKPTISIREVDTVFNSNFTLSLIGENFKNVQSAVILIKYKTLQDGIETLNFKQNNEIAGLTHPQDLTIKVGRVHSSHNKVNEETISVAFIHPESFNSDFIVLAQLEFENKFSIFDKVSVKIEVKDFYVEKGGESIRLTEDDINIKHGGVNNKEFKSDENLFEYSDTGNKKIKGLTDMGKNCEYLMVPRKVTHIENGAFEGSKNLKYVRIPSDIEMIGEGVFKDCDNLANIELYHEKNFSTRYKTINGVLYAMNKGVTSLFAYPMSSELVLFDTELLTELPKSAFEGAKNLRFIYLNKNFSKEIEGKALANLPNLKAYLIDNNNEKFTSVDGVLYNKSNSSLIHYPSAKLGDLNISASVTDIKPTALSYAKYLKNVNVDAANGKYSSDDGVLLDKTGKTLYYYPSGRTEANFYMPSTVTALSDDLFVHATNIKNLFLSKGVEAFGENFNKIYDNGVLKNRSESNYPWIIWAIKDSAAESNLTSAEIESKIAPPRFEKTEFNIYMYTNLKDIKINFQPNENTLNFGEFSSEYYNLDAKNNVLTFTEEYIQDLKKGNANGEVKLKFDLSTYEQVFKFTVHKDGDVDNDLKITAADARLALRYSAKQSVPDNFSSTNADVNKDSIVTAQDARIISRVSARLQKLPSDIG